MLSLSFLPTFVEQSALTFSAVPAFTILAYDILLDLSREVGKIHALIDDVHLINFR